MRAETEAEKDSMLAGLIEVLERIEHRKPRYRKCPDCSGYGGCAYGACMVSVGRPSLLAGKGGEGEPGYLNGLAPRSRQGLAG